MKATVPVQGMAIHSAIGATAIMKNAQTSHQRQLNAAARNASGTWRGGVASGFGLNGRLPELTVHLAASMPGGCGGREGVSLVLPAEVAIVGGSVPDERGRGGIAHRAGERGAPGNRDGRRVRLLRCSQIGHRRGSRIGGPGPRIRHLSLQVFDPLVRLGSGEFRLQALDPLVRGFAHGS